MKITGNKNFPKFFIFKNSLNISLFSQFSPCKIKILLSKLFAKLAKKLFFHSDEKSQKKMTHELEVKKKVQNSNSVTNFNENSFLPQKRSVNPLIYIRGKKSTQLTLLSWLFSLIRVTWTSSVKADNYSTDYDLRDCIN